MLTCNLIRMTSRGLVIKFAEILLKEPQKHCTSIVGQLSGMIGLSLPLNKKFKAIPQYIK